MSLGSKTPLAGILAAAEAVNDLVVDLVVSWVLEVMLMLLERTRRVRDI